MVYPAAPTPPSALQAHGNASGTARIGPGGLVRNYGFHVIATILGIALAIM